MSAASRFLLPPEAYYSQEWWEAEQRLLFGRTYNLVAYESDIPKPGDYVVAQIGLDPVIVVRGADGEIGAFANMCRHRGMRLASADGHADESLRCFYHGWEYAFDGSLSRVPQRKLQFPDLDEATSHLIPFAVGRWAGMIFVHPGEDPPPFEKWLGGFVYPDKAGPYAWDELVEVDRIDVPLRCNWKLYIENHVDIYHLWYLHAESLGMYDHPNLTWWESGPHWGCVEAVRPGQKRLRPGMLPITSVAADERPLLRANLIFPNVPMTTMETSVATFQVIPTGPETCRLDLRIRGERGSKVEDRDAFLKVQRDEDGTACEEIQAVIRSPRFAVGPLAAEYERPIQLFQQAVLALLP
jgi:Rieske 2Fe-2S family protein